MQQRAGGRCSVHSVCGEGDSKDSVHNVNIDLDRPIDDRLGVGLVEQVHEDLALLNGDAGVGRDGVAVNEAAIGRSDIQQGAVGDDVRVHGDRAVAQAQTGRALAGLGIVAGGFAGEDPAVGSGRIGGAVRAGQRRDRRTGTVGLDDMIGGLHRGGHIDHHAVFQLTVHPALAGGHGLLALRAVLQRGGAAGVAEVQAGVDILGIVGDGLRLDLILIIDAVDHDAAACCDQLVQCRLGVVLFIQGDASAFQRIGNGAKSHLHRILLVVGLNGHGECALDVQGSQAAAERGVIDMVALFGFHAGKAHHAGGVAVSVSADHQLPRTIGVSDVGQPQIRGGHGQREQQAHGHDAERQHTGGGGTGAAAQCFLKFDGSDTEQLLSFYSLEYDAGLPIPAVARSFFTPYSGAAVRLFTSM